MDRNIQQVTTCPWCAHALLPGEAQCPECHLPFDHSADLRPLPSVDPHHVVVRGADCHQPALVAGPIYLDPIVLPASHASQPEARFAVAPDVGPLARLLTRGVPAADHLHRMLVIAGMLLLLGLITLAAGLAFLAAGL